MYNNSFYTEIRNREIDRVLFSYHDFISKDYSPTFRNEYMSIDNILASAQDYVVDLDKRPLERVNANAAPKRFYKRKDFEEKKYEDIAEQRYSYFPMHHSFYIFNPEIFLAKERTPTKFIENFDEIKEYVYEAFKKLMEEDFPKNILVNLCTWEELKREYPEFMEKCRQEVLGFAINRKHLGLTSLVFVKRDNLDRLLLTLGHEIGHVLSRQLQSNIDEEAKAFAFSIAWAETIKEHNIAGLRNSIKMVINPAENGIHDKALEFVLKEIRQGRNAVELFKNLSNLHISAEEQFPGLG